MGGDVTVMDTQMTAEHRIVRCTYRGQQLMSETPFWTGTLADMLVAHPRWHHAFEPMRCGAVRVEYHFELRDKAGWVAIPDPRPDDPVMHDGIDFCRPYLVRVHDEPAFELTVVGLQHPARATDWDDYYGFEVYGASCLYRVAKLRTSSSWLVTYFEVISRQPTHRQRITSRSDLMGVLRQIAADNMRYRMQVGQQ